LASPDSFGLIVTVETRSSNSEQHWAAWNKSAERELGAFLAAVAELFGSDTARQAAEDWLDELESQQTFPVNLNWRPITFGAATRLAQRLNGNSDIMRRYRRCGCVILPEQMLGPKHVGHDGKKSEWCVMHEESRYSTFS
jgi:hypothetical protein